MNKQLQYSILSLQQNDFNISVFLFKITEINIIQRNDFRDNICIAKAYLLKSCSNTF